MKRIITTLALACVLTSAWAQDFPAGMRREIVEIEQNDHEYSLFSYKEEDGSLGYYLSLGRVTPIVEAEIFGGHTSFSHIDETCLCLGATKDEALATIESLLALLEEAPGTTAALPCRRSSGGDACPCRTRRTASSSSVSCRASASASSSSAASIPPKST